MKTIPAHGSMMDFVRKNDVLRAEVLWTLHTVSAHYSYKSNENVKQVFQAMFPDSVIASKFSVLEKSKSVLEKSLKSPWILIWQSCTNPGCTSWEYSQSGGQNKINQFLLWELRSILIKKNLIVLSSRLAAFPRTCKGWVWLMVVGRGSWVKNRGCG